MKLLNRAFAALAVLSAVASAPSSRGEVPQPPQNQIGFGFSAGFYYDWYAVGMEWLYELDFGAVPSDYDDCYATGYAFGASKAIRSGCGMEAIGYDGPCDLYESVPIPLSPDAAGPYDSISSAFGEAALLHMDTPTQVYVLAYYAGWYEALSDYCAASGGP